MCLFLSLLFVFLAAPASGQAAGGANDSGTVVQAETGSFDSPFKNKKNLNRPSVALVLGGGGAMGTAHLPVLEVIEELGIPIDMIIGISMGAIIGGLYCSGLTLDEIKTMLLAEGWAPVFQDRPRNSLQNRLGKEDFPVAVTLNRHLQPSVSSGYSSGVYVYELLKLNTIKIPSYYDFDTLPIPFRSCAVNALSGELEIFKAGDIAESIRASMSIPGVFQPIPIDGNYYIDGGIKNNFPLNIAKEMGFDIIIGINILDKLPEITAEEPHENILNLRRNPLALDKNVRLLSQMAQINFLASREPEWDAADLVIAPDVDSYTMLDFLKIEEIYKSAENDKQRYIDALLPIKEKIEAATKEATPPDEPAGGKAAYDLLPYITIDEVRFEGVLPFDSDYINKAFNKLIKNRGLTEKNFRAFMRVIYNTGNYDYVITRIDTRNSINTLHVLLANTTTDLINIRVAASFDYRGTASSDSVSNFSVLGRADLNGLSGPDSQLSIMLSVLSNISGTISYLHPLTPGMFLFGGALFSRKQITTQSGLSSITSLDFVNDSNNDILTDCGGKLLFGVKFNESNLLTLGPGADYMNYSSGLTSTGSSISSYSNAVSFHTDYLFSTLSSSIYATSGFYCNIVNTFVFPLRKVSPVYNMVSIDSSAAFPVSDYFSIVTNLFTGADVLGNLSDKGNLDQKPFFGFTTDRMYFPQIASNMNYFSNKAAASIIIQFRPWQNITIFGGQIIVSLSASIGRFDDTLHKFFDEYDNFDGYYWNTSVNVGLRITDKTGASLRAGMGKTLTNNPAPFLAFDFGVFRY
jgi:NTE family protein